MRDETEKTGTRYGMEEAYWGPSIKAYAARHQTIEGGNCGYIVMLRARIFRSLHDH